MTKLNYANGWEDVKHIVIPCVGNPETMKKHPAFALGLKPVTSEYMDLVLYYRVLIDDDGVPGSFVVTQDSLNVMGVSKEEMIAQAEENLRSCVNLVPLENAVMALGGDDFGESPLWLVALNNPICTDGSMPNMMSIYGAGVIAAPDILANKMREIGMSGTWYIIPSSVHEVLTLRADVSDAQAIAEIIKHVNADVVDEIDRLSDHLYQIDLDAKSPKVTMAI